MRTVVKSNFSCKIGFVFYARPQPDLLPQEKGQRLHVSDIADDCPANPIAGFSTGRRMIHPLLGGEGRGEDGRFNLTFSFGLHRSRIFRQGMRRACLQFVKDRVADALRMAPQMRIPKPQRLDAA